VAASETRSSVSTGGTGQASSGMGASGVVATSQSSTGGVCSSVCAGGVCGVSRVSLELLVFNS
jgi:hypothetical protein